MYIATRQQLVEDGQWYRRGWIASVDFNRTRDDYKHGIGNFLIGEYWLGLEKIHRLAGNKSESKFRADLGVTKKIKKLHEYAWLQIGKEEAKYKLIKL